MTRRWERHEYYFCWNTLKLEKVFWPSPRGPRQASSVAVVPGRLAVLIRRDCDTDQTLPEGAALQRSAAGSCSGSAAGSCSARAGRSHCVRPIVPSPPDCQAPILRGLRACRIRVNSESWVWNAENAWARMMRLVDYYVLPLWFLLRYNVRNIP